MNDAGILAAVPPPIGRSTQRLESLRHSIEHAAHLLPTQAPIRVFIHHNTLHAFEDMPFEEGVQKGGAIFGCHAYLPEDRYREKLARGRIVPDDLSSVLLSEMGETADVLVGLLGTRFHLRLAMLQYPLRFGSDPELRWLIRETNALHRFRSEAAPDVQEQLIEETRRWVMRDLRGGAAATDLRIRTMTTALFKRFDESRIEQWTAATWEAFTLNLLWHIVCEGVRGIPQFGQAIPPSVRHRDLFLQTSSTDTDQRVNNVLIRFCAAFLDQGIARQSLPMRERGFWRSWSALYRNSRPIDRWLRGLPAELKRIGRLGLEPLEIIEESIQELGIGDEEREEFLAQTLLALRGWAGMIWQLETNAEWTVHPAPQGSLVEYVAVRLILERLALRYTAREVLGYFGDLRQLRSRLRASLPTPPNVSDDQRAFVVFQLAQVLRWSPPNLFQFSKRTWTRLIQEIEDFSEPERRRIYHLAFERRYRTQTLDAIIAHSGRCEAGPKEPKFQVVCCLDEREESFRRHLEEVAPECETFGVAGFFGVAMYYRGVADAHYVPLCPIVVKPRHYVQEEVVYPFEESHRRRAEARRALGMVRHWVHTSSQSILGGALTALLGSLASIPLLARVLFPHLTARIHRLFTRFVQPPPMTRLLMERAELLPGTEIGHLGYTLEEMIGISECVLRDIGLTAKMASLVFIVGHGSSSLNNPHESAYDCGACGGGHGGPNARVLAGMLSDPRVRERLVGKGLTIPRETVFVGAFHNTCDDSIEFYDLDRLPSSHHDAFEAATLVVEEARRRNAHERCRRFQSAELAMTREAALRHVERRAQDLSQVRPECGHATNAICFIGRRRRIRGLFCDRRAFLASYDPTADCDAAILTRILQAVIPVCAGINLEYYFCYVDPTGYGCGTKLPHNIASLIGVMEGAASDLRPGLPRQMTEIHEPVRLLFIIETTPDVVRGVLDRNPALRRMVCNEWVQLATLDPQSLEVNVFQGGRFEHYVPETTSLPVVSSSVDWYRGWRDHLGYASVIPEANSGLTNAKVVV